MGGEAGWSGCAAITRRPAATMHVGRLRERESVLSMGARANTRAGIFAQGSALHFVYLPAALWAIGGPTVFTTIKQKTMVAFVNKAPLMHGYNCLERNKVGEGDASS